MRGGKTTTNKSAKQAAKATPSKASTLSVAPHQGATTPTSFYPTTSQPKRPLPTIADSADSADNSFQSTTMADDGGDNDRSKTPNPILPPDGGGGPPANQPLNNQQAPDPPPVNTGGPDPNAAKSAAAPVPSSDSSESSCGRAS